MPTKLALITPTKLVFLLLMLCFSAANLAAPSMINLGATAKNTANTADTTKHSTAKNLDVVLVMDSSGSMKKTDPKELRKPAAKLFISLLGAHDRVGIVSFSDQGYPVSWLTPAKGERNRQYLFKGVDRISSKGVYTNLHGAIEGAMRVLYRPAKYAGTAPRQRIIVLMSDGKMDLGDSEKTQQHTQQLLHDTLPALKAQGIEVHTIAFTPQSDQALLKKIADKTGGTFNMAKSDRELHDAYTAIFEQNKSPNILPFHGDKFTIDKAIKEVTIVGSKDNAQVVLSLMTPDGRMLTPQDKGKNLKWFESDQFDLITITKPTSGQWQLRSSAGKNKAYVITDLKQQLDITPHEPAINEGVLIKTWLEDKGAMLNKPSIMKSLKVEMHVDTPDGQTHILKMEPELSDKGTPTGSGAYTSLIALPVDGAYRFKVIASARTFSREKDTVIHAVVPPQAVKQPPKEQQKPPEPMAPSAALKASATIAPVIKSEKPAVPAVTSPPAAKKPAPEKKAKESKAKKPAAEKHKTAKHKDAEKKPAHPETRETNALTAVLIFLGINVVLSAIGGGVYFVIRRRRSKTAANDNESETDSSNDDSVKDNGNDSNDKAA